MYRQKLGAQFNFEGAATTEESAWKLQPSQTENPIIFISFSRRWSTHLLVEDDFHVEPKPAIYGRPYQYGWIAEFTGRVYGQIALGVLPSDG
jgi:hypothetical protein